MTEIAALRDQAAEAAGAAKQAILDGWIAVARQDLRDALALLDKIEKASR